MQSEWFSLLNGWLSLYILQISADSSLCMSSRFEDFSDKLEEGSKLCEAYTEGTVIQTYNIFRITDRENDLCNFLKLYESAYGKIRHAKMYTIITFVTLNGEEMSELSNSRDLFIEFVINYVRRKESCYILGNVYMTIECIPAEHIKEYDFINTNVVNIKKVLHKFEEMVVESICEITLSVIKERIVKDVRYFLYDEFLGKESLLSENFSVDESVFRTKHEYRIKALINSANNGRMYEFLPWRFGGKYVTFNKLCSKILEYESTIGVRYFTVNPYELFRNFEYLTHEKHKKAFDKGIMDVIMRVTSNLKEEKIIERFVYIMRELLRKTIEVINDPKQFKDSKCLHNYKDADYLNFLFSNVEIVALFDDYFKMLQFDDIQKSLEDKYKLKENTPIQKPPAENISKILFDDELTDTSVYTLFHVLEDAGVLEKISTHQTIFVQRGSLVEIDKHVIGYKKHKSDMISLTVNDSTISAFIETIEKTTRPCAESMDLDLEDFSVPMNKMGLSACADDNLAMCTESNKKVRDVKITIAKYEKLVPGIGFEGLIEQLENMCLDNQKFTSIIKRMVSIVHNSEKSYIYIIYQFDAASKIYKLSLIYNVYSKSSTGNCTEFGISNRFVKCFDNGPLLLLNNLHGCLQCMQLSAYDEFEIPNLWIIDDIEYAYTQKVIYTKLYQRVDMGYPKNFFKGLNSTKKYHNVYSCIYLQEILDYKSGYLYRPTESTKKLIAHLGITKDDFLEILFKTISSKHLTNRKGDDISAAKRSSGLYEMDIAATKYGNGTKVLRVVESMEANYIQHLTVNYTKLHEKVLEYEALLDLSDDGRKYLEAISPFIKFLSLIVNDLLYKCDFYDGLDCYSGVGIHKDYLKKFLARLDEIMMRSPYRITSFEYPQKDKLTPSSFKAIALRKGMKVDLIYLFRVVLYFYKESGIRQMLIVTTILVKGKNDQELHEQIKRPRRMNASKYYNEVEALRDNKKEKKTE